MATTDLDDTIQDAAKGPAFASDEEGSFKQQPLKDLVEADRYLSAKRVTKAGGIGIRFVTLKPPGAVS
jgi:hypothetical protein